MLMHNMMASRRKHGRGPDEAHILFATEKSKSGVSTAARHSRSTGHPAVALRQIFEKSSVVDANPSDWSSFLVNLDQYVVWIDDNEARILQVASRLNHELSIHALIVRNDPTLPASDEVGISKPDRYFHRVARALDIANEIVIVGPSATKDEFTKFLHKHEHAIDPRILGVESIDDPTDSQLVAFAELYFDPRRPRRRGNGSGDT